MWELERELGLQLRPRPEQTPREQLGQGMEQKLELDPKQGQNPASMLEPEPELEPELELELVLELELEPEPEPELGLELEPEPEPALRKKRASGWGQVRLFPSKGARRSLPGPAGWEAGSGACASRRCAGTRSPSWRESHASGCRKLWARRVERRKRGGGKE